jgi:hypothetical protein
VIFPRAAFRSSVITTSVSEPRKSKYNNPRVCCGSSEKAARVSRHPGARLAFVCAFVAADYFAPHFDVEIINDHVVGGIEDSTVFMIFASALGAGAYSVR